MDRYRFVLAHPAVNLALMAPDGADELDDNLLPMDNWRAPIDQEFQLLAALGERLRRHADGFP